MVNLPRHIYDFLFNHLDAKFAQRPKKAMRGINADREQTRVNLGTYFPRSYIEIYNIFYELFENVPEISRMIRSKKKIRILALGSGAGGSMAGLLQSMTKYMHGCDIKVYCVEGNENAHKYLLKTARLLRRHHNLADDSFQIYKFTFAEQAQNFTKQLNSLLTKWNTEFDIVISWKFLSEFYNGDFNKAKGAYRGLLETVSKFMTPAGICALLDLTMKNAGRNEWIPTVMASEIQEYVTQHDAKLGFLLPLSCASWGRSCFAKSCYTQKIFQVRHPACRDRIDKSKVSYKVLVSQKKLKDDILNGQLRSNGYRVATICGKNGQRIKYCENGHIVNNIEKNYPDGFSLHSGRY
ncbi:MAG: hypothetical protein KAR13_12690, partial [Desulfobulbaceae bacterium]|nr:hypothetical protein [Desulfobulbaceae bacterium]